MKLQYLIVFFVILLSCNKTDKLPAELYSKEKMAVIMKDIYVLEFKIRELSLPPDSSKKIFDKYLTDYYEEKNIDTTKYKNSYNFYTEHPELLEEVYAIIADSLSLQSRIESNQ